MKSQILALALLFWNSHAWSIEAESKPALLLWPNGAPGEQGEISKEKHLPPPSSRTIDRITNITAPTITVHRPPSHIDTGAAVVVCPGGGYNIIAFDLEGTEVVEWLNSIGVTAVLLKYRVPRRAGREKHEASLQDAQRALSLVRNQAQRWAIDPKRIGILGFSAGGHLSATASTQFAVRAYTRVDAVDDTSCRPNFTILIYPAYLSSETNPLELTSEVAIAPQTPPCFLVQTQDDGVKVESSLAYYIALHQAEIPAEMHLYPTGGHGYGLRKSDHAVSEWPDLCETWLKGIGVLPKE